MRSVFRLSVIFLMLSLLLNACRSGQRKGKPRLLVFSKTAGFRHASIPAGVAAFRKISAERGYDIDTTENAAYFTEDSLQHYDAVIFLHTTGDVLDAGQQADFERYIQAGGNFLGIHAAADCEYNWPWYGQLVGAYFKSHSENQRARLITVDTSHPSSRHLPKNWERLDEWYNFRKTPGDSQVNVVLKIDESSYTGGENGDSHPMAWYHDYDGGRAYYTALGHTVESFQEEPFLKHLEGALTWLIGNRESLDYSKATSIREPEENRFSKTVLSTGFDEPTEMAILPDLNILITQRKGEILYYDNKSGRLSEIGKLDVYHKATAPNVNAEEGLMGIALDPEFADNGFVYMFYSPIDSSVNRLSRFTFRNGQLDMTSEKIVIEFYSQRNICCHTGGSVAFGPRGNLYLSTGDNATPFDQPGPGFSNNGFAPLDQRKGYEQFDAQRSSANPNDLRGKILRIKILPDGSYTIPEGNLFEPGTPGTRPEIYVMGNRNPYRISIDRKTGFLYWGEVGPDAANDSLGTRGPRGYDELNQARKAGFFGWPLFVGNNYPYRPFNYATGTSGPEFDARQPLNNSRNNTGLQTLPPAMPAFIYYPYAVSAEFPELGTGGRNAMAGPVYYPEFYPAATRFPDYLGGKLFFYDWMRGWIKVVSMNPQGDLEQIQPFMGSTRFNSPIDMEMGPDGRLYILEYGTGWFTPNADAAISRIDFNGGNRLPVVQFNLDRYDGSLPLTIEASAEGSRDPDGDPLSYQWYAGNQPSVTTREPRHKFTFSDAGDQEIWVEVSDGKGGQSKSQPIRIYAGNESPRPEIRFTNGNGFYFPGKAVNYQVRVTDKEDGVLESAQLQSPPLFVQADFLAGPDRSEIRGHEQGLAAQAGKGLAAGLDCKACHREGDKSIGPSYKAVAERYAGRVDAREYLTRKIIQGGGGVWGETAMAAHPDLRPEDAGKIVDWILSLSENSGKKSLPATGRIMPTEKDALGGKWLQVQASYNDQGGPGGRSLTGTSLAMLRSPVLSVSANDGLSQMSMIEFNGVKFAVAGGAESWIKFDSLYAGSAGAMELSYGAETPFTAGYHIAIVADGVQGQKLGEARIPPGGKPGLTRLRIPLQAAGEKPRTIYVLVRKADPAEASVLALSAIRFYPR